MQSNPFSLEFKEVPKARAVAAALASLLGCDYYDSVCLRSKSAEQVVEAQGKVFVLPDPTKFNLDILLQWTPTIDGVQLSMQPLDALVAGKFNKVRPPPSHILFSQCEIMNLGS